MQTRLKTRLNCPKGPPPDAVHMSSKLVDPEPVQNTHNYNLQQQTPKIKHGRSPCWAQPVGESEILALSQNDVGQGPAA